MTDIFGVYNIRSRISVGLVVLAPLLIQAYMLIPEAVSYTHLTLPTTPYV